MINETMISLKWLSVIIPVVLILGAFLHAIFATGKRADESTMLYERKAAAITKAKEDIIEIFLNHADCEHDVDTGSAHYPGHHDITYDIDRKGEAKIKAILEAL